MPGIRLQDYTAKIKELIGNGLHDEAIAHCRHILKRYPKHIDTYCLLGEACLEKGMYREAIEFFQRALCADPENFIARVGLGIICDEQGALPEAVWHMERAFELAPGNAEVRRELQRLYAQRDGVEKTRLKLTRGALGRLYARNGLYERAIGEFRAVLRQDPSLPDVRVALIEALWHEGRRLEAVEICLELLDALPNCLKANLILGEIWMRGGDEDASEQKLNIARALDPENLVAHMMMGTESPLPPEEVSIPGLEITALAIPRREEEPLPAAWEVPIEKFGVEVEEAPFPGVAADWKALEEVPDWLQEMGIVEEEEEPFPAAEIEAPVEEAAPAEEVPGWLQELVGEEAAPSPREEVSPEAKVPVEEVPSAEEIPDWLRELEGPEAEEAVPPVAMEEPEAEEVAPPPFAEVLEREAEPAEEIPDWLRELRGPEVEEAARPPVMEAPEEEVPVEELPDWLKELRPSEVEEVEAPVAEELVEMEPVLEEEAPVPEAEVPESLRALVEAGILDEADLASAMAEMTEEELAAQRAEEVPAWLKDLMAEEEVAGIEEAAPPVAEVVEEEVAPVEEIPDWLRALEEIEAEEIEAPPVAEVVEEEVTPVEEIPDWVRALEEIEVEEVEAPPVAEEWVEVEPVLEEEAPVPEAEVPESLRALVEAGILDEADLASAMAEMTEEELAAQQVEEVPAWLKDLMAEEEVAEIEEAAPPVAEVVEEEVAPLEEIPDWLRALEEIEAEEIAVPPVAEVVEEEVAPLEEIPDWVRALEEIEVEEVEALPVAEVVEEEVAPPVIEELVEEVPVAVEKIEEAVSELEVLPEEVLALEEAAPPIETEMLAPFDRVEVEEEVPPSLADELLVHLEDHPRDYNARLELARLYRAERDWNAALAHYEKLISARKFLPAVIDELTPLVEETVDQARLYQLLGDAYMQEDRLDDALEMYRLARKALMQG